MSVSEKEARGREFLKNFEAEVKEYLLHYFLEKGLLTEALRERAASETATALADYLCFSWGGHQPYIPKDSQRRAARLYREFTGSNHEELARKYGLSVSAVYKIIQRVRETRRMQQCSLLDME